MVQLQAAASRSRRQVCSVVAGSLVTVAVLIDKKLKCQDNLVKCYVGRVRTYGQYCPAALALDLVGDSAGASVKVSVIPSLTAPTTAAQAARA